MRDLLALHPLSDLQAIARAEFPKTLQNLRDAAQDPPNGKPLESLLASSKWICFNQPATGLTI